VKKEGCQLVLARTRPPRHLPHHLCHAHAANLSRPTVDCNVTPGIPNPGISPGRRSAAIFTPQRLALGVECRTFGVSPHSIPFRTPHSMPGRSLGEDRRVPRFQSCLSAMSSAA
jgi:hypothetical protein